VLPHSVNAQAVVDTSLNRVVSDSTPRTGPVITNDIPLATPVDTVKPAFQPIPKKSALYSAILPGAGQFYNRQYWKIPIIYVGVGVSAYFLIFNTQNYRGYRQAYIGRLGNATYQDDYTKNWRLPDLKTLQDQYRKQLDLTILLTGIGFTLQVLDALTFAHLKNFDISKDISLRMQPVTLPTGDPGLGLVMRF
jgi:hypothetical protein